MIGEGIVNTKKKRKRLEAGQFSKIKFLYFFLYKKMEEAKLLPFPYYFYSGTIPIGLIAL